MFSAMARNGARNPFTAARLTPANLKGTEICLKKGRRLGRREGRGGEVGVRLVAGRQTEITVRQ